METNTGGIDDFVRVQKIKKKLRIKNKFSSSSCISIGSIGEYRYSLTKRVYNRSISYFFPTNDEILREINISKLLSSISSTDLETYSFDTFLSRY